MEIGVSIATIRLNKKNSKKDKSITFYSDLSEYIENCKYYDCNFEHAIEEFCKSKIHNERVEELQKYFGVKKDSYKKVESDEKKYISFTVTCGSYGLKSNITNTDTGNIDFEREINHADVKEFRVMIAYKKNRPGYSVKKGVILFQTLGQYGIKMITIKKIKDFFSNNFNVTTEFYNAATREAFERIIENGGLKSINLIKNKANPNFSNLYGINCGKETRTILFSGVKEKQSFISKIMDMATSKDEVYEFDGEYNDISLTINVGKRQKTVKIRNLNSFYIVEELPKGVMDESGLIIIEKIDKEMISYSNDYLNTLIDGDEVND